MKKLIILVLILNTLNSFGQIVKIDTIRIILDKQPNEIESYIVKFPLIKTGDSQIDSLINIDIVQKYTGNEFPNEKIDVALTKFFNDGNISMEFAVSYNKNGIVSLNISSEGCGAYCSNWVEYYNYSTLTGQSLTIDGIIKNPSEFEKIVVKEKNKQFAQQIKELKELYLSKEDSELDESTYEWALENYKECDTVFNLNSFMLNTDYLQIIKDCDMPHAIRNLTPIIELKYKYSDIQKYLINRKL